MNSSSPAHLRRSPSQQRSRERVERILDAAAEIVDEQGLDALRVGDIAKRAGVPLGTLYQFFARKDDIVYALAERFTQRFADVLESVLSGLEDDFEWHELLDLLLDAYAAYYRSEPGLGELWVGARIDPEFIRADHQHNNTRFAEILADVMADRASVGRDELATMIYVCWEASQALLETAFRIDHTGDPKVIEQAKIMASRYLAPVFVADPSSSNA